MHNRTTKCQGRQWSLSEAMLHSRVCWSNRAAITGLPFFNRAIL